MSCAADMPNQTIFNFVNINTEYRPYSFGHGQACRSLIMAVAIVCSFVGSSAFGDNTAPTSAAARIRFSQTFADDGQSLASGWKLLSAVVTNAKHLQVLGAFKDMRQNGEGEWLASNPGDGNPAKWQQDKQVVKVWPGGTATAPEYAIVSYTVRAGESGFYAIGDSFMQRATNTAGRVELRVFVQRVGLAADRQTQVYVFTTVNAGEFFDFDSFLGYLDVGDRVFVAVGPDGDPAGDETKIDFSIVRTPGITVSVFAEDLGQNNVLNPPGKWSVMTNIVQGSLSARILGWDNVGELSMIAFERAGDAIQLELPSGSDAAQR
jgi:hypothetical protein